MLNKFETIQKDLMNVELPQVSEEENSSDFQKQIDEIKDFRD